MDGPNHLHLSRQEAELPDVLVVGRAESHTRTDRKCLRSLLKTQPQLLSSGAEAARIAASRPLRLVVCDATLEDMSGLELVKLLRLHPELQALPVVMISMDNTREAVLEALKAGSSGYLLRPYSLDAFCGKIKAALDGKLRHADAEQEPSLEAFVQGLERLENPPEEQEDPVEKAMQEAVALLRIKEYKQARELFRQVLEMEPEHPTAHHGLGRCWLALGHPDQAKASLRAAAESYLHQGKHARANAVYEELRKRDPDAKDPLSSSVEGLLRGGETKAAAQLMLRAQKAAGLPEGFMKHVARACHFTEDPLGTARGLCDALEEEGGVAPAAAMRSKLLANIKAKKTVQRPMELIAEREESSLGPVGNLRTVLAVAKHTFQAYRRNSVPERA